MLSNQSSTTVNFSCDIEQPFHVEVTKKKVSAGTTKTSKKTVDDDRNKNRFSLKPNTNLEVRSLLGLLSISNH